MGALQTFNPLRFVNSLATYINCVVLAVGLSVCAKLIM